MELSPLFLFLQERKRTSQVPTAMQSRGAQLRAVHTWCPWSSARLRLWRGTMGGDVCHLERVVLPNHIIFASYTRSAQAQRPILFQLIFPATASALHLSSRFPFEQS